MPHTLLEAIASTLEARRNCAGRKITNPTDESARRWYDIHTQRLAKLAEHLPRGAGFDDGTRIAIDACTPERIVLTTAFHHMNEHGFYTGWSEHTIYVRPSFVGTCTLRITTHGKRSTVRVDESWREHAHEVFFFALIADAPPHEV